MLAQETFPRGRRGTRDRRAVKFANIMLCLSGMEEVYRVSDSEVVV